jgi:hypothetical protein
VFELHQFHGSTEPLGYLVLERSAAHFDLSSGWCVDMCGEWFAGAFVETERFVKEELRYATRAQPWEAALVAHASKCETSIAIEAVPAKES